MRIVHVTDVYAPRVGGIERQIATLVKAQQAHGHDVRVVAPPGAVGAEVARRQDLGEPDVVHGHVSAASPFTVGALRDAASAGYPTAMTVHSIWPRNPVATAGVRLVLGLGGPTGAWSAVSRVAADRVAGCLPAGTPVAVVPNGIDLGWWSAAEPRRARQGRAVHVVLVNRLAVRKRVLPLLVEFTRQRPVDVRLTIVGDGPQRRRVQRFVDAHGLSGQVRIVGSLATHEVRHLLHDADLFLAPAERESFGIAALEARAAGVPVIGRQGSGVADLIRHGVDGAIVDGDRAMVDVLSRLSASRTTLARWQHAAWRTPPAFGVDASAAATMDLYIRAGAFSPADVRARRSLAGVS